MFKKIIDFLNHDVWLINKKPLTPLKAFLIDKVKVCSLVLKGFQEDSCYLKASALTFYSLLSIVPVIAMSFGIARGFGVEKMLESNLREALHGHEEVADKIFSFSNSLLQNTKSGLIVGVGILLLFWTVIKLLGYIEHSFNDIWGIKQHRTLQRKVSDYLSIMLIGPILFIIASSMTVFINAKLAAIAQEVHLTAGVPLVLKCIPLIIMVLAFLILYVFMPNTQVRIKSAFVGGIIAGTLYQLLQFAYVNFQIFTSKYNAIYGSFAALPLFLGWLQFSWVIVLFGCEISFAVQNVDTYEFESESLHVNNSLKRILGLQIVKLCVDRFINGQQALNDVEISEIMDVPIRLVRQIIYELVAVGILCEIKGEDEKVIRLQPALSIKNLTVEYVLRKLDEYGVDHIPLDSITNRVQFDDTLKKFQEIIQKSPANLLLSDL